MYNWMHPNKAGMKLVAEDWYSRIESLNVRL
jgi:lysophospholipase L1-like esterase